MLSVCPGCGLALAAPDDSRDARFNASAACRALSDELAADTLTLGDAEFRHQLHVDAYAAQHAGPNLKPIGAAFALAGLLLTFENGYTGRQVQRAHMTLAKRSKVWPRFTPPETKARLTVQDVLQAAPGEARDARLREWGRAVWESWQPQHDAVRALVDKWLFAH